MHRLCAPASFSLLMTSAGLRSSCLSALKNLWLVVQVIPPYWSASAPLDTCGAGDAYAAGVLYAFLSGFGVSAMGRTGARVASAVISQRGAGLTPEDAQRLSADMLAPPRTPFVAGVDVLSSISEL